MMNSFVTVGPESGHTLRWRDYGTFVLSGITGMVAATVALVVLSDWLGIGVLAAKLVSILVSFAVNFSLSHFVVFRTRRPRGDAG
jgi:putative flippase GtrA